MLEWSIGPGPLLFASSKRRPGTVYKAFVGGRGGWRLQVITENNEIDLSFPYDSLLSCITAAGEYEAKLVAAVGFSLT